MTTVLIILALVALALVAHEALRLDKRLDKKKKKMEKIKFKNNTKNIFLHRDGQSFLTHLEFTSNAGQRLVLGRSLYQRSVEDPDQDRDYYKPHQWYVFYGNAGDEEPEMGYTRLAYPKAARAVTAKSALGHFLRMARDIDFVTFRRLKT